MTQDAKPLEIEGIKTDERMGLPSASRRNQPPNFQDLTGRKFERLTVLNRVPARKWTTKWACLCSCGNMVNVAGGDLRSGHTRSCGCLMREVSGRKAKEMTSHGHAREGKVSPTFIAWTSMQARCLSPGHKSYADYGGRGITVCDRWMKFENFLADMGERPEGMTLDRFPNQNGNYEPGNCRWATQKEQQNNRRSNVVVSHDGESLTVTQWAERVGMRPGALMQRLKRGVPFAEAIRAPVPVRNMRSVTLQGLTLPLATWIRRLGMSRKTVHERLSRGWTPEKALTTPPDARFTHN